MRFALFFSAALAATVMCATTAFALPQDSRVPGGIALLPLPTFLSGDVHARFQEHAVLIGTNTTGERFLVIGIPLGAPPGEATVQVRDNTKTEMLSFTITEKKYTEQHITLPPNDKHVNPGPAELARYAREAAEQQAVYKTFSENGKGWPGFIMPTKGEPNSSFGLKRFFNGEPRAPHLGMDIAAPEGQDTWAPADGVVVQTGDYFFNGRTVMIDHGHGLISMLCHLHKIKVKTGDRVKQGDVIGLVGKTGRATGPHLHWTVSLNDARIDPLLVLSPTPAQQ